MILEKNKSHPQTLDSISVEFKMTVINVGNADLSLVIQDSKFILIHLDKLKWTEFSLCHINL